MAAPTSTNEVTVRRLSSVITQLWAKIKDTFAPKSHNHNASDINAGTLPTARGGTGMSKDSTKDVAIGLHDSLSDWTGDSSNILETETIAAFGTGTSAGRYSIGKIYNWIKGKLESVFAAASHTHSDYLSKSTTSGQTIKSNLYGKRFEVRDDDGNYGAFLVGGNGNILIKGHTGNDVLTIKKKDDASGVASITASYNWIFNNEINASISGRASYLKDVSDDGSTTYNCYLKWSSTDISKVSPSGGQTRDHSKYLAAWEKTSNGGNPSVNAVDASNVTVGSAATATNAEGLTRNGYGRFRYLYHSGSNALVIELGAVSNYASILICSSRGDADACYPVVFCISFNWSGSSWSSTPKTAYLYTTNHSNNQHSPIVKYSTNSGKIYIYYGSGEGTARLFYSYQGSNAESVSYDIISKSDIPSSGISESAYEANVSKSSVGTAIGSTSKPVYVKASGFVAECGTIENSEKWNGYKIDTSGTIGSDTSTIYFA